MGLKLGVAAEQEQRQRLQEAASSLHPSTPGTPAPHSGIYKKVGPHGNAKSEQAISAAGHILANKKPKRKLRSVEIVTGQPNEDKTSPVKDESPL
jgi:hypothetical protein